MPTPDSYVTIKLGGKERPLRYPFTAFIYIEKKTGRPVTQITQWQTMTAAEIRTVVFAGLHTAGDKKLTEPEVGSWLWLGNLGYVLGKVTEAITKSVKRAPVEEAKTAPAKAPAPLPEAQ